MVTRRHDRRVKRSLHKSRVRLQRTHHILHPCFQGWHCAQPLYRRQHSGSLCHLPTVGEGDLGCVFSFSLMAEFRLAAAIITALTTATGSAEAPKLQCLRKAVDFLLHSAARPSAPVPPADSTLQALSNLAESNTRIVSVPQSMQPSPHTQHHRPVVTT